MGIAPGSAARTRIRAGFESAPRGYGHREAAVPARDGLRRGDGFAIASGVARHEHRRRTEEQDNEGGAPRSCHLTQVSALPIASRAGFSRGRATQSPAAWVSRAVPARFAVHSAVVLTCGNGSGGTGTSSARQIGTPAVVRLPLDEALSRERRSDILMVSLVRRHRRRCVIPPLADTRSQELVEEGQPVSVLGKVVLAPDFEDGFVCAPPPCGRVVALRQYDDRIGIRLGELRARRRMPASRPLRHSCRETRSSRACRHAAPGARRARGRDSRRPRACGSSAR